MALVANNNIPALQTYNSVKEKTKSLQKSIEKLSTGLRINSAADDAAGLAISEKMRAQIRGLDRAVSNSQDGISMLQTAEGALSETHSILQRMRELSVQAANDTLTQQDRAYIQLEIDQLREEVTRIGNTTQFNKKKLLDGSAAVLWSSDKLSTKALINGGLRGIDSFGQKNAAEGNFVIDVNANPGKAQVQKSDVFTIKHKDVIIDVSLNDQAGINGVSVNNLPAGTYQITKQELTAAYSVTFDAPDSTTAAYLAEKLTLAIENTDSTKNYTDPFTATVTALDVEGGTMTLTLSDGGSNAVELEFTGLNGGLRSVTATGGTGDFDASTGTLKVDESATRLADGIDLSKLTAENQLKGSNTATSQTGGTTLNFTITDATDATWGQAEIATPSTPASGGTATYVSGGNTDVPSENMSQVTFTFINGKEKITEDGTIVLPMGSFSDATFTLTVGSKQYSGITSESNMREEYPDFTLTFINTMDSSDTITAQVGGHHNNAGFFGVPSYANYDVTAYVPATVGSATPTNDFAMTGVTAGAEFLTAPGKLTITVGTDSVAGDQSDFSLDIGGKIYSAADVDLASGTVTLANGSDTITLSFTNTLSAGELTDGTTITVDLLTATSPGGAVLEPTSNLLTVSDYEKGITFKPQEELDAKNSIYLRVAKSYKPTQATAASGIQFDYVVVNEAGNVVSQGITTLRGTTGTVDIELEDASGGKKTVTFDTQLNLNADDLAKVRVGDEVAYNPLQSAVLVGRYGTLAAVQVLSPKDKSNKTKSNASVLMEVTSVSDVSGSVDFKVTANILNVDGSTTTRVANITLNNNDLEINSKQGDALNILGLDLTLNLNLGKVEKVSDYYKQGDTLVYNVYPHEDGLLGIQVQGEQNKEWDANWIEGDNNDVTIEGKSLVYAIDASKVNGQDVHLKNFYVDEKNGTIYTGDIILSLAKDFDTKIANAKNGDVLASFEAAYVGQVAKGDVKLRDLDKFWNSEGRFLLNDPQTLTITQGDGTKTGVTLYATDTLQDAATKLNEAIAKQLGQQSVLHIEDGTKDPAAKRFVTFVDDDEEKEGTSEAVAGTFVIRSIIAGANGQISFAGDEELLNKLSLNEIQAAEENSFTVSVWDAHTGKSVASSVKITGNKLIGVVNENVDVVFDPMANIKVEWNEATKSFSVSKAEGSYQTLLHLADNTTVFQIGANEGEDMGVNFGDMRSEALGLNSVLVTDRESAARSITIIDNAIDKVSMQRSKIGAYQNRLEHTITNLTVAGENLTAAESRIRDTDMAREMMNFTKLQIMLQAGTSMLAQANTLPRNILSLLRA